MSSLVVSMPIGEAHPRIETSPFHVSLNGKQQKDSDHENLCWAYVISSIIRSLEGREVFEPCQLAERFLTGPHSCCTNTPPDSCDKPYDTATALACLGYRRSFYEGSPALGYSDGQVSLDAIKNELRHGRPVAVRLKDIELSDEDVRHIIVIHGYETNEDGEDVLLIYDPDETEDRFFYNWLVGGQYGYGYQAWSATIFVKRKDD